MGRRRNSTANMAWEWIQKLPMKVKIAIGVLISILLLVVIKFYIRSYYYLFIIGETIHAAGILILLYKLFTKKTCSGLSLKTQEITALFLVVRIGCGFTIEPDVHTMLDITVCITTLLVVYMMRIKLKATYNKDLDNLSRYYVLIPCAVLAVLVHPYYFRSFLHPQAIAWAFCAYLEAVSVMPQLRLMQNAKMAEPYTAHYVFALGLSRFVGCAHWIIMLIETRGRYLHFHGFGSIWMYMNLIAEIVQTFILGDFCYYYIKRGMAGKLAALHLPV